MRQQKRRTCWSKNQCRSLLLCIFDIPFISANNAIAKRNLRLPTELREGRVIHKLPWSSIRLRTIPHKRSFKPDNLFNQLRKFLNRNLLPTPHIHMPQTRIIFQQKHHRIRQIIDVQELTQR
ncbi:hypothetical protein Hanom_Chr00s000639g01652751 [Helianthus anomalus]